MLQQFQSTGIVNSSTSRVVRLGSGSMTPATRSAATETNTLASSLGPLGGVVRRMWFAPAELGCEHSAPRLFTAPAGAQPLVRSPQIDRQEQRSLAQLARRASGQRNTR